MLIEIYLLLSVFAFVFFFTSFKQEPKVFFSAASMIIFFFLAVTSGNIEKEFCFEVAGAAECTTGSVYDAGMMIFNLLFGLINLIYLLANAFGYGVEIGEKMK